METETSKPVETTPHKRGPKLDPEAAFDMIVTTALLGTERQGGALPMVEGLPGELISQLEAAATGPEGRLLGAAAVLALYRRTGRQPGHDRRQLPASCESDEQPVCSRRATRDLAMMLSGTNLEVLPEWLAAAGRAGWRVPEEHLPALMDWGRSGLNMAQTIRPLLGKRGQWLAAQNPEWDYLREVAEAEVKADSWQTGLQAERTALLQHLRRTNPAAAREWLAGTWAEETPEDRASFIKILETGLSQADEIFLEKALDDRRKEVRRTAASLLAQLPGSQLVGRMIRRASPLLTLKNRLGLTFAINLPEECTPDMVRDGIEPKPNYYRAGEKAWWLEQIVACIPPAHWSGVWQEKPERLVNAAVKSEWAELLLAGWTRASQRFRDSEWAEALLMAPFGSKGEVDRPELMEVLPAPNREKLVAKVLKSSLKSSGQNNNLGWNLVAQCRHSWSAEFSREMLAAMRARITHSSLNAYLNYQVLATFKELGRYFSPALAQEAAQGWPTGAKGWETWQPVIDQFVALVLFRQEMTAELALTRLKP